jgi:coproporphyrinogen III oxidase-like Fe-S oxidoreductase
MKLSALFLLGAGGTDRSDEHAKASAKLASEMDPRFVSLLTLTVIPGTPMARQEERGEFAVPDVPVLLKELRTFIAEATPTDAIFRTNHASNWLPLEGRLPRDKEQILEAIDAALEGKIPLRPRWALGL